MKRFVRDDGLSLVLLAAFAVCIVGQGLTGWAAHNADLAEHGRAGIGLGRYLAGGAFVSAVLENWESNSRGISRIDLERR